MDKKGDAVFTEQLYRSWNRGLFIGEKLHSVAKVKDMKRLLCGVIHGVFIHRLRTSLASTGEMSDISHTQDKGKAVHSFEFQDIRWLDPMDGLMNNICLNVQPMTRITNRPETHPNCKGHTEATNKLFEIVFPDPDHQIQHKVSGFTPDGQYKGLGVQNALQEQHQFTNYDETEDPCHKIELATSKAFKNTDSIVAVTKYTQMITAKYHYSDKLHADLRKEHAAMVTYKTLSETKFVGHYQATLHSILVNNGGNLKLLSLNLDLKNKDGRRNRYYHTLSTNFTLVVLTQFLHDILQNGLTKLSKAAQSRNTQIYALVPIYDAFTSFLDNVVSSLRRDKHTTAHLLHPSIANKFSLSGIELNADYALWPGVTDRNAQLRAERLSDDEERRKTMDCLKGYKLQYDTVNVVDSANGAKCHKCHKGDLMDVLIQCDVCHKHIHYNNSDRCHVDDKYRDPGHWLEYHFQCSVCKAQGRKKKNSRAKSNSNQSNATDTTFHRSIIVTPSSDKVSAVRSVKNAMYSVSSDLSKCLREKLVFSERIRLCASIFLIDGPDGHKAQIDGVVNARTSRERSRLIRGYFEQHNESIMEQLVGCLNEKEQIYDLETVEREHREWKRRLFHLCSSGALEDSYRANKQHIETRMKQGHSMQNELFRLFMTEEALYDDLQIFMKIWLKAESMGCLEGLCEGDVSKMTSRLQNSNRYRMDPYYAAMEYVGNEQVQFFKRRDPSVIQDIVRKTASEHIEKWGVPLVCNRTKKRRAKKGVKVTSTMDRVTEKLTFQRPIGLQSVLNVIKS